MDGENSGLVRRLVLVAIVLFACVATWIGPIDALNGVPNVDSGSRSTSRVLTPEEAYLWSRGGAAESFNGSGNVELSEGGSAPRWDRGAGGLGPTPTPSGAAAGPSAAVPTDADIGSVNQVLVVAVPAHEIPTTPPTTTQETTSTTLPSTVPSTAPSTSGPLSVIAPNGALPPTGLSGLTLKLAVIGVALIDLGWLFWSLGRRDRRRRATFGATTP